MASPAKRPCCDVSRELMDAIEREDWTKVNDILSESSCHVADSVVTQIISKGQWGAVMQIIKCVGGEERTWDIEGVLVKNNILLSVADRDWTCITESPNGRFSDSTFQWVIKQACTRNTDLDLLLLHCADDRLDSVLTILVERRLWQAVEQVLERSVSDSMKQWSVREACTDWKKEDLGTLIRKILPHCADDQLDCVLTTLVKRRLWDAVLYVLNRGVSDSCKRWVALEVCAWCASLVQEHMPSEILLFCADDQANCVLTTLVKRRQWWDVGEMLKKGVSDSIKQWAVQEACKLCRSLIHSILPHCADDQADCVLTTLVERRLWRAVGEILKKGVSDSNKQWAVREACKYFNEDDVKTNYIHWCLHSQSHQEYYSRVEQCLVDDILPHWRAVREMLKKGVSDSNKQWAVREACQYCKQDDLATFNSRQNSRSQYNLRNHFPVDQLLVEDILPHCADGQLDSVLTTLVERRLWRAVGEMLKKGVSDSKKQWAVQTACHCKQDDLATFDSRRNSRSQSYLRNHSLVDQLLVEDILPHRAYNQLESVLTTLVERRLWLAVLYVLKRGVSDSSKRWVVLEMCACCKSASQEEISQILLFCADDQADCVLTTLVERRLWRAVGKMLKKGVSDSNKQWAVQEACKHSRDAFLGSLIHNILPHCADDQLECVLTTLVERRLWQAVLYVLKRGVSDSSKRWVVLEMCACCKSASQEEISQILLFCADDQADCVLTTLVERRMWLAVGEMLKKGVSDSKKQWAVREACKYFNEDDVKTNHIHWRLHSQSHQEYYSRVEQCLVDDILPHCADDQLDSVLTTLVERRLWRAVGEMLKKGVSDSNKQWAVREACHYCKQDDLATFDSRWDSRSQSYLRNHSLVDQLLVKDILPHCADGQLESVLTPLVERRLWRAVLYVLKRGVSDFFKRWVVLEVCACRESVVTQDISSGILLVCADDQVDCVLTTLVERRQWLAVGELLKKGVNDSNKQWAVQEACRYCRDDDLGSLIHNILPHCVDNQLDSVLTTLVERRLWRAVGEMLKKGVSDSNKQWAVREACHYCKQDDLATFNSRRDSRSQSYLRNHSLVDQLLVKDILPHCADGQLESVLTPLVERRRWRAVLYVLKRGVSDFFKRWVVLEACACCESGIQEHITSEILLFCADDQVECVLTTLVELHLWKPVGELLQRGVTQSQHRWAVGEACKTAESDKRIWVFEVTSAESYAFVQYILPHCSAQLLDSILTNFAKLKKFQVVDAIIFQHVREMEGHKWTQNKESRNEDVLLYYVSLLPLLVEHCHWTFVQTVLHSVVMKSLCRWAKQGSRLREDESVLLTVVNSCRVNVLHSVKLFKVVNKEATSQVRKLHQHLGLTEDLCELLFVSLLHQVCVALCSGGESNNAATEAIENVVCTFYAEVISCISSTKSTNGNADQIINIKRKMSKIDSTSHDFSSNSVWFFLHVLQQFNLYYTRRSGDSGDYDDNVFLMVFALLPFSSELQSVALRIMLRQERWDVISHADLSGVWEQDRRHLLQAAVKQRQWSVVKRWADHTLYDDQSVWALNEALNEKQWGVALLLADHGLTDIDLMRVHYRLAKYADWDVILHMFERGADVAEVGERLGRMKDNKRISEESQRWIDSRLNQVRTLEKTIQNAKADALENACRGCNWIFVLYTLLRNPSKESVCGALKVAMKKKAWHVVMKLVRIGMDAKQRHSLFSRMLKRRQWGVCRVLLEHGLRVQLCLKVLPHLMEMNQWALVARVMEHDVGDDVRQQVMQRAWERREGSVVWLCIKSLPTPLSREEREALFQRAFSCELWQVIKPLVEEKDETGIRHRDIALLEAIDLHEWDLVDHCQRHHADINMKDDDGHTPLQRAAMKKDWEAVEELVVRDGDPNQLDGTGCTVLHRVVTAKQWSVVKLLIEYQADIHKEQKLWNSEKGVTPLGMLIDARRVDIIDHSLFWCPDQFKGVNGIRETSLHVACVSGCYDSMYNLVARRVNPLAVTNTGQSALVYSVLNEDCPQRMVAECIRLGFSTHQPKLTDIITDKKCLNPYYRYGRIIWHYTDRITSPFLCALLRGLPVVAQMLYESGACSQRELFRLYTELPILADTNTDEGRKLQEQVGHAVVAYQNFVYCIEDITLPYLTEIATTPRNLVSTCRLVISHCLTLSKTRHRDVDQLPLTERMKNFVLFSDLTDPDFGKDTT